MSQIVAVNKQKVNLRDISKKDRVWDIHKAKADVVAKMYEIYADNPRDKARSEKVRTCAGYLRFIRDEEFNLHLIQVRYCKNYKLCPICQWRRSLALKAKFYTNMPELLAKHKTVRFIFLTLTIKNPLLSDLRQSIKEMNLGFKNLLKRKELVDAVGYIRNVEVTKPENDLYSHPHFHVLLAVKSTYFKPSHYLTEVKWKNLWRDVMGLDYIPQVDVRIPRTEKSLNENIKELLKYPVKEADIDIKSKWFLKYVDQVHRLRFISTAGIFKGIIKDTPLTDEEMTKYGDDNTDKAPLDVLDFSWNRPEKRYKRTK